MKFQATLVLAGALACCPLVHAQPALTSLRDATVIRESVTKGGVQMPAMRTVLTKEQIRDVSDYVAAGLPPEAP